MVHVYEMPNGLRISRRQHHLKSAANNGVGQP